jgi:hypothetical protein
MNTYADECRIAHQSQQPRALARLYLRILAAILATCTVLASQPVSAQDLPDEPTIEVHPNLYRGPIRVSIPQLRARYADGSFSGGEVFQEVMRRNTPQQGAFVATSCGIDWYVGMRVVSVVAHPSGMPCVGEGEEGTVVSAADSGQILVEWRGKLCGHDGNGNGVTPTAANDGNARWFVDCDEVVPVPQDPAVPVLLSFVGLQQGEFVLNYYNGGQGSRGSGPGSNYGIRFFNDTPVYYYYNGSGSPSPGVIALVQGDNQMIIDLLQPARALSYYYSSTVNVTLYAYSGPGGSGTLLGTNSFAANTSGPYGDYYRIWTPRNWVWNQSARSIVAIGSGNYWGIDDLVFDLVCPGGDCNNNGVCDADEIVGNDCNGNGTLDVCDIANGSDSDCNANGVPDSCEVAGSGTVRVARFNGPTGLVNPYSEDGIVFTSEQEHVHLNGTSIWNHADCCSTPIRITAQGGAAFKLESIDVVGLTSSTSTSLIGSNGATVAITSTGTKTFGNTFQNVTWVRWSVVGGGGTGNQSFFDNVTIRTGGGSSAADCNGNGVPDSCDIASGTSADCNGNGRPDSCDIATGSVPDCNLNGIPDGCDIQTGASLDCNGNGIPDSCDIAAGAATDVNGNGIPDSCEPDCNGNGLPDAYEVAAGLTPDCNQNGVPDSCDIASGAIDCDSDGVIDSCELASGSGADCNGNGALDNCDIASGAASDCNGNAIPDSCDLASGTSVDCNGNTVPDSCDIASGTSPDCNGNSVPDSCDLATGTPDCNGNSIPDSCDIASGTDPDPEGDGIPNSCEPPAGIRMTGPSEASGGACAEIGAEFVYDIFIDNPSVRVVAGQFALMYDNTVLQFVEVIGGEEPFTYIPLTVHDAAAGRLLFIASVQEGGTGTLADSRVARLRFTVIDNDCDGSTQIEFNPVQTPILIADGGGNSEALPLTNPAPVRVVTGAPGLTGVPSSFTVAADAGAGCQASRTLVPPTASSSCGSVSLTWTRTDGQSLGSPWPCGTTTVTWTATDICGRVTTDTTSVTVQPHHLLDVSVAYEGSGYAAAMTRCIDLELGGSSYELLLTFADGIASTTIEIPVGSYNCATADDDLHSLLARNAVSIQGTRYAVVFAGASALVNGDLTDDNVIDVTDWGIAVVAIGGSASVNTDCSTTGYHIDFDGNGQVNSVDGNFVLAQFLTPGATACGAGGLAGGGLASITVAELAELVGSAAVGADLNGDAIVDRVDIQLWLDQNGSN